MAYQAQIQRTLSIGTCEEKKRILRSCVDKITMAPDMLEVEINYKLPEAIGAYSGSGGGRTLSLSTTRSLLTL